MIGNKVIFTYLDDKYNRIEVEGLIVDAYTDISGSVSGKQQGMFGFSEGSTSGSTKSERMYKVLYYSEWDADKKHQRFKDIRSHQIDTILSFVHGSIEEIFKID